MQTATRKTHSRIPIPVICRRSIAVTATIAALMVLTAATAGAATPLFNENFSYAAASNLNGQGGWTAHSAGGTNPQTITAGSLSYPGYPASGIGNSDQLIAISTSAEDDSHSFTGVTSGTVYAALLANVTSASIGDYFFSFIDGLNTSGAFYGRVFVQASGGGYQFGLQFKSKTTGTCTVYKSTVYSFGTTHLVVVKYTF